MTPENIHHQYPIVVPSLLIIVYYQNVNGMIVIYIEVYRFPILHVILIIFFWDRVEDKDRITIIARSRSVVLL